MDVEHNNETAINNADDWNDCTAGEVSQMVNRLRAERRMHQVRQTTSAGVIAAMVLVSGYFIKQAVIPSESVQSVAGIHCSEVQQLGEKYVSETLDENKSAQIKNHLADCESCWKFIEKMRQGSQSQPPDAGAAQDVEKRFEKSVASRGESIIPVLSVTGS